MISQTNSRLGMSENNLIEGHEEASGTWYHAAAAAPVYWMWLKLDDGTQLSLRAQKSWPS